MLIRNINKSQHVTFKTDVDIREQCDRISGKNTIEYRQRVTSDVQYTYDEMQFIYVEMQCIMLNIFDCMST